MNRRKSALLIVCLCVMIYLVSGCSAFRGSRAVDMAPFAENTTMMFAEAAKVNQSFRLVHLKPYTNLPEVSEFRHRSQPLVAGLKGLEMYSNQVVALDMAAKSDKQKNALFASYLEEAAGKVARGERLASLRITRAALDSTFASIRSARTFLGGIGAASPLVNAVVLALLEGLEALNEELPTLIGAIDREIERNYRDKRRAYEGLTRLQAQYLIAATWLYEGKSGNPAAVDSLLHSDPSLKVFIPSAERASPQELAAAEEELVGRLERINLLIDQLADEKSAYLATRQELEDLRVNIDQRIKVARDAVVVWGQSHRNLGQGIPVPPLINVSAIASGMVKKAVPLP